MKDGAMKSQNGRRPMLPDVLQRFINDPTTIHERIVHNDILYVKVVDKEVYGSRYVLLRAKHPAVNRCLRLYQADRYGRWRKVLEYYPETKIFYHEWHEIMDVGLDIVVEYTDRMALFE